MLVYFFVGYCGFEKWKKIWELGARSKRRSTQGCWKRERYYSINLWPQRAKRFFKTKTSMITALAMSSWTEALLFNFLVDLSGVVVVPCKSLARGDLTCCTWAGPAPTGSWGVSGRCRHHRTPSCSTAGCSRPIPVQGEGFFSFFGGGEKV